MSEDGNGVLDGYDFDGEVVPLGRDTATGKHVQFPLGMANRHGTVTGATGTGKSRTIQSLAEWFSQNGVSVLMADGKGDMSGLACPGQLSGKSLDRAHELYQFDWFEDREWTGTDLPVEFLALGGNGIGIPVRVPIGSFGYKSLAKLAELSPAQTLALGAAFLASKNDAEQMETVSDLSAFLRGVGDDPDSGVSESVVNRVLNKFAILEENTPGLYGGPGFDVMDLINVDEYDGFGRVSIIDSSELSDAPEVMTTFLISVMETLADQLPQVGDAPVPKLVIFLDEAHLIFEDAPKEFIRSFVRTIKRLRSNGVGVFLCSQSASDIPSAVLSQCANRIQHALRANTPEELSKITRTVKTFPISKVYDIYTEITTMGTGVALVCLLDDNGIPTPPSVCKMYVPRSSMEPMEDYEIQSYVSASELAKKYQRMEREHAEKKEQARRITPPVIIPRQDPSGVAESAREDNPVSRLLGGLLSRQNGSQRVSEPVMVGSTDGGGYDDTEDDPWE
jgi:hypothetical protein